MHPLETRKQAVEDFRAKHAIPRNRHGRLWDIDHIVPVSEGGGAVGLDGLRTVCLKCHRQVTRELMARLREKRRLDPPAQ
jgi:5-methylcytosine-specific restriction endonuclease McrA